MSRQSSVVTQLKPPSVVLDTQEVTVRAGDFVILRGANHAWSNRTGRPAVVAIASHDGRF